MKQFFFGLLGISMNPATRMTRKSGNVFNIFKKTLDKLSRINTMIEEHKKEALAAIQAHQQNHDSLNTQLEQNNRLREKLNEFVNPQ